VANHLKTGSRKKILLVDDDIKIRALLREILDVLPYDVVEAADGKEALERLALQPVDLIITDRSMPHMDGLEFLKNLRQTDKTVPVLMMSAYGDEELWGEAVELGVEDYLLKPFDPDSVLKIVKGKLGD